MNLLTTILLIISTILGSNNNAIHAVDVSRPLFRTTKIVSTTPAIDLYKKNEFTVQEAYNITQIIPLTTAEISKNTAKFYRTINSKSLQISNNIDEVTAKLTHPSYYERHRYSYNQHPPKLAVKNITCEFSNFLKIKMNTQSILELTGYYNIKNNSTTLHTVKYLMRFAGINISILKTYNPANLTSSISETDIEIEYQDFKIELSGNDGEEFVALNSMSSLIQEIKSYFEKEIIRFFHSMQSTYDKVFTTCMQPKENINEKFANFSAHELDHYYQIGNEGPDYWKIVMDQITIRGLTNFKNFSLNTESNELQLSIENVSGNVNWYYHNESDLNVKPSQLHFKIDRINIETDFEKIMRVLRDRSYLLLINSHSYGDVLLGSVIKIDAASVVCENSNDSLSSLASAILLEKTKVSVIRSITESLQNIYNNYDDELRQFIRVM
ncbi:uncharacterized protein LOC135837264 [Planococcus citri]|uniref:uncharacterized protein LOC135837264 n=1 Tax=Planococcus citri TaxID=170843 RepID=UPI0031F7292F